MIKSIAIIKDTGNPKIDRIWGQVRHVLDTMFSLLIAFGVLQKAGVDITPESWQIFLNTTSSVIDAVYIAIGAVGKLVVHASSWFSKKV